MATKKTSHPVHRLTPTATPSGDGLLVTEERLQKQWLNQNPIGERGPLPGDRAAINKLLRSWLICRVD